MKQLDNKHLQILLCLALVLLTIAVYLPVRNHDFVIYDDDVYVLNNKHIQTGLTAENIKWAFTTYYASNWHPVTWLSLMLDCRLFGEKPGPMHIVNVLFHIVNTLLLFIVFTRMTKRIWASAFIASLFALHPLHVESVAWVAERKDVLSAFFWLLTMLAYIRYVERPCVVRYLFTILFFIFGLLSKPMLVTLPFVLLLLDYWPLERFGNIKIRNLLLEKLPFFIAAGISCVITFFAQQKGGAVLFTYILPLHTRFANAFCSYLAYIEKMFVPINLAVLYPYNISGISIILSIISAIILAIITVVVIYYGRRCRYLIFGWLWYLGTLVPVIGIVQVGVQTMADRYTYVPLIGLFVMISFAAGDLLKNIPYKNFLLSFLSIAVLLACVIIASIQLKYWQNSNTLFEHTIAVTPDNPPILNNYANILAAQNKNDEAKKYMERAIKLLPDSYEIRNNYARILKNLGKTNEAVEQYQLAMKINPQFYIARYNLGLLYYDEKQCEKAIEQFKIYLGPDADLPAKGVTDETTNEFRKILASKTDTVNALSHIGYCLAQKGDPNQAVSCYQQALRLDPDDVISHGFLALSLSSLGRYDESIEQCKIVLAKRPNDVEMQTNLGILYQAKGDTNEAIKAYKKALQIDPNSTNAREKLKLLLH